MVRWWWAAGALALSACHTGADGGVDGADTRDRALEAVAAASHSIAAIAPGDSVADLEFLGQYVRDARVVGLGEATHGTREFFQLKHRVFQYLVEREGFRTFAIEAKFEPSIEIDRYIRGGEGDVEALVNGLGFWTWDTEEVIELVRWMRAYNARGGDQLNFYGFDVQDGGGALKRAIAFAAEHAGEDTRTLRARFDPFLAFDALEGDAREQARSRLNSAESLTGMHRAAMDLSLFIERNETLLAVDADTHKYQLARGAARVAVWWLAMSLQPEEWTYLRSTSVTDVRDRGMADMVHWIRGVEGDAERIALWAHNAHVGKIRDGDGDRMMGMLRSALHSNEAASRRFVLPPKIRMQSSWNTPWQRPGKIRWMVFSPTLEATSSSLTLVLPQEKLRSGTGWVSPGECAGQARDIRTNSRHCIRRFRSLQCSMG